ADIFERPSHPYTQALLASTPGVGPRNVQKIVLTGELPSPLNPPSGCVFSSRCPYGVERGRSEGPGPMLGGARIAACHFAGDFLQQGFPQVPAQTASAPP